jgi:uncharacterized protein (DUF3820 family)
MPPTLVKQAYSRVLHLSIYVSSLLSRFNNLLLSRFDYEISRYPGFPYKKILCDLPDPYLVWFHRNGFPQGKMGMLLAAPYEIKLNGLEYLLKPIRKKP